MTTRHLTFAAFSALLVLLAGCGADTPSAGAPTSTPPPPATTPATLMVLGQVRLTLSQFMWDQGEGCWGMRGYSDIVEGAQVDVTDDAGKTVGVGRLKRGVTEMNPTDPTRAAACELAFAVENIPAGRGFYGVAVTHRGVLKYSERELATGVSMTIG